jgi:hypothetical protein
LNHCRLFLAAYFLSDFTAGDGRFIMDDVRMGRTNILATGESPGLVNIAPLPMTGNFGGAKYGVAFWHEENI